VEPIGKRYVDLYLCRDCTQGRINKCLASLLTIESTERKESRQLKYKNNQDTTNIYSQGDLKIPLFLIHKRIEK